MDLLDVGMGGGYWMELAQVWDRWRTLVSEGKKLLVP
jgi:hypothetical protein